jgi:hypothetical protein
MEAAIDEVVVNFDLRIPAIDELREIRKRHAVRCGRNSSLFVPQADWGQ